jgi:hypothetical protein
MNICVEQISLCRWVANGWWMSRRQGSLFETQVLSIIYWLCCARYIVFIVFHATTALFILLLLTQIRSIIHIVIILRLFVASPTKDTFSTSQPEKIIKYQNMWYLIHSDLKPV